MEICSKCPRHPKDIDSAVGLESYPANMSGLYVVDLDQKLNKLINPNADIVPAEMQVIIQTLEDSVD